MVMREIRVAPKTGIKVNPNAYVHIENMRDTGYRLEAVLADLIENSIAAGATEINLFSDVTNGDPRIAILDNGTGMTESELIEVMRPGNRSPLAPGKSVHSRRDGIGLKRGPFSLCRRVTHVSRKDGDTCVAIWDLDRSAEANDWVMQIPNDPLSIPWADHLADTGTLIVWEKLDKFTEKAGEPVIDVATFNEQLDFARSHLERIFHRYLSGESGLTRVQMSLNGNQLIPLDPFNPGHPATIVGPVETILVSGYPVLLQTFRLPHRNEVSPAEWERYGGPGGYLVNQGFYVYRDKRSMVPGRWFGLARHTELTKLVRVRIDSPSELDQEWKFNVKMAYAQPPRQLRERLRQFIETITTTTKNV